MISVSVQEQTPLGLEQGFLELLLEKLYKQTCYDFREYKRTSIERRINRRLRATRTKSYREYSQYLDSNPEEYNLLFKDLTINVTEFFRDAEAWEIFRDIILPNIISRRDSFDRGDTPIRLWSAGCSTGQEAFSAAILFYELMEQHSNRSDFEIIATDIDKDCLAVACKGLLPTKAVAGMHREIIDTYFEQNEFHSIRPSIQEHIHFKQHDLVLDDPLTEMDCILCRNVAIYFTRELQERLFTKFYHSLRRGGYLFLGKAESLYGQIGEKFTPVNTKWKIYQKQ